MKKYFKNPSFDIGLTIALVLLAAAIISLFWLPGDPNETRSDRRLSPPCAEFPLGTDHLGRDTLSRVLAAALPAIEVGTAAVFIGVALGITLGALAGYSGGWADAALMKAIDVKMAFPTVLLALMIISVRGAGLGNTALVLGIIGVPRFARIARGAVAGVKTLDYVKAARVRGASHLRILFVHILPNVVSPLAVTASFSFSAAALAESGLSFLGLGVSPPMASWGYMLKEAQKYFYEAPFMALAPGVAITLLVLGFNLLGDGIDEVYAGKGGGDAS